MRVLLLTTVLAATHLRRLRRAAPVVLAQGNPNRLQHSDVYDNDFVHDDTEHPGEAIKINIKESENRLKEAKTAMTALESKLSAAKKAKEEAEHVYSSHVAETSAARAQVSKYNESLALMPAITDHIAAAKENLSTALQRLNETDTDATAAAEAIKEANIDFHEKNELLVDARENASLAQSDVESWVAKVKSAEGANVSLAEWSNKLNQSRIDASEIETEAASAKANYDLVHKDFKVAATKLSEAQKLFDVDKETYENLVGPYGDATPEASGDENLWTNALTNGLWHNDVAASPPVLGR